MKRLARGVVILVGAIVLSLGSGSAGAYEIYNESADPIGVMGELCPGCFEQVVKPKESKSCPGDNQGCRGTTWISWMTPEVKHAKEGRECGMPKPKGGLEAFEWMAETLKQIVTTKFMPAMYHCPHRVPAHGWVTVKGENGDFCHVKDQGGKLLYDGPAQVQCGPKLR